MNQNLTTGPYFHLSPASIERQNKFSREANDAARRQAISTTLVTRLTGEAREAFFDGRVAHTTVPALGEWLELQLFGLQQQLTDEENRELASVIHAETLTVAKLLPYSSVYGPHFIERLKRETLASVAGFLQFTREPWYAGLSGFYLLNKPDDVAYFRDLIVEHIAHHPDDATPVMLRAVSWLGAEIERLTEPGSVAFGRHPEDVPVGGLPTEAAPKDAAAPPEAPAVAALSPADRILANGFTFEDADQIAYAVGITDTGGNYCLGPRKLGAVVGFALELQQSGKLRGAISDLTAVLGPRWCVEVRTRKTSTGVAGHYASLVRKELSRLKKTD